ncbi:glycosyltransferase [Hyphococcus flavus]|uniref:Glycosyltransferase n=1 Tax=Hyphococcus flavus TaxID=1866326 RepID=A0AAE9ZL35_9PROT|nr:glycosyltransferase [Hyphococcus flavus]WDI33126.1 glycosyltransferase [Hyphococcus flavus]
MAKKVLFVTRKWPPAVGGMETYSVQLAEELARQCDLKTIFLPGRTDGRTPSPAGLLWFGVTTLFYLALHGRKFDVVHAGDMAIWPLAWIASVFNRKAAIVLSAHGTDVAYANRTGWRAKFYRSYLRYGAKRLQAARVIANSRATANLLEGHGFTRISVVPLAAEATNPAAETPENYLLFTGRLTQQKGCGWFINNILPHLPNNITLKVAGVVIDETERNALNHDRVEFLGPVRQNRLSILRRKALANIVPNLEMQPYAFEGFGLSATEGAADGGIVIASDLFGLKDAVINDVTGFLLAAGDAKAWKAKIIELTSWEPEIRQSFVLKSIEKTRQYYSWSRVCAETLAAYNGNVITKTSSANSESPMISVVMTAYNAERYIESAIESILTQTFSDFEFIIIDDASTDATIEIINRFAASDLRIQALCNEHNLGVTRSLNRGLSVAKGSYIARMDADDISLPHRFEKQVAFLDTHPDYSVVASGVQVIDEAGNFLKKNIEATSAWETDWISLFRMPFTHPAMMCRRAVLRDNQISYDTKHLSAQDFRFAQQLLQHGKGLALGAVLFQYRMHTQNVTSKNSSSQRATARSIAIDNAIARFPQSCAEGITNLFNLIYGAPTGQDLTNSDLQKAILALCDMEKQFCEHHSLNTRQVARIRTLASRWLAAGAVKNGLITQPAALVSFLWRTRRYLSGYSKEAVSYALRRAA